MTRGRNWRTLLANLMGIILRSLNSVQRKWRITTLSLAFLPTLSERSEFLQRTDPVRNADRSSRPLPKSSAPHFGSIPETSSAPHVVPLPETLSGSEPVTPLLVWVDDNPSNNRIGLEHAQAHGIKMQLLRDTKDAKEWFTTNLRISLFQALI